MRIHQISNKNIKKAENKKVSIQNNPTYNVGKLNNLKNDTISFSGRPKLHYPSKEMHIATLEGFSEILKKDSIKDKGIAFYDLMAKRSNERVKSLEKQSELYKAQSDNFKAIMGDIIHEENNIYNDVTTKAITDTISDKEFETQALETIHNLDKSARRGNFLFKYGDSNKVGLGKILDLAIESAMHRVKGKNINLTVENANLAKDLRSKNTVIDNYNIFSNLIGNAAKYTPENGNINIKLKKKKGNLSFTISDTGIGIPKDQIETVKQGIRATNAVTSGVGGTGHGFKRLNETIENQGEGYKVDIQSPVPGTDSGTQIEAPIKLTLLSRIKSFFKSK